MKPIMCTKSLQSLIFLFCGTLLLISTSSTQEKKPNIIFVLTDDEDIVLGSLDVERHVHQLIAKEGVFFQNAFVTTPVCCPSRSSILTGKYIHNTRVFNNSIEGGCKTVFSLENETIGPILQQLGYKTGFFGKYLNQYNNANHVPPGWDRWYGLIGNSKYYNYSVSDQGKNVHHGDQLKDYFPHLVFDNAIEFMEKQMKQNEPFFLYVSPPAPHRPATPFPTYAHRFPNKIAPRLPSFNYDGSDKHWIVRNWKKLDQQGVDEVDELYRDRLRTLLTIDEKVKEIVDILSANGQLENSYIIYTSDHGYHLGEFRGHGEKRQPYEQDIRVPLLVRGPRIPKNVQTNHIALAIDHVPTIVDFAGGNSQSFDGMSLKNILLSAGQHKQENWRDRFIIEYHGEHGDTVDECAYFGFDWMHDCRNNTWNLLRIMNETHNIKYSEFPITNFKEFYDLNSDPCELKNAINEVHPDLLKVLRNQLNMLMECTSSSCHITSPRSDDIPGSLCHT